MDEMPDTERVSVNAERLADLFFAYRKLGEQVTAGTSGAYSTPEFQTVLETAEPLEESL